MSLTTKEKGAYKRGGLIFGWKNALLIWGAYILGSLYTGGGGAYLPNFTVLNSIIYQVSQVAFIIVLCLELS